LFVYGASPLADEIEDDEGYAYHADETGEELEEIPIEGIDHVRRYYTIRASLKS
jgi:hypothetical protein